MENAAAWSVDLLMIVLYFLWMNQSITVLKHKAKKWEENKTDCPYFDFYLEHQMDHL